MVSGTLSSTQTSKAVSPALPGCRASAGRSELRLRLRSNWSWPHEVSTSWRLSSERRSGPGSASSACAGPPRRFCTSGRKIILLLNGYDKAKSPGNRRQDREIATARKLLTAHQEAEKRAKARQRLRLHRRGRL